VIALITVIRQGTDAMTNIRNWNYIFIWI